MKQARIRGAAALLVVCVLGTLGAASVFAGAAFADGGAGPGPTPVPVAVTIPANGSNGQTPTPSPSASSNSGSGSGSSSPGGNRGGGSGGSVAAPPHQPGTEPRVPKHPATGTLKLVIAFPHVFRAGENMTISAPGFNPGEKVQLVVFYEHGKPVKIGNFAASASGSFSHAFVVPALDAGTDTIQLTGWDSSKIALTSFLMGASWVAPNPTLARAALFLLGGLTGLGALAVLVYFGVASLRRLPALETGV
jgi:hypothetical protein